MKPKLSVTIIPYHQWKWYEKIIEQIYRKFHKGQIRTIVIKDRLIERRSNG